MSQIKQTRASRILLDRSISIADAHAVLRGDLAIALHGAARSRCAAAHRRLQQVIAERRHVYGLTTGFGPLANRLVSAEDSAILQQNLVHHLASGVGPEYPWQAARGLALARLMSILQGASGASDAAIGALVSLLNSELAPVIPSKGTVGASGDLTPLAHMVLCLQGRGIFMRADGSRLEGAAGLGRLGIEPLDLSRRDGLALVNGTSAMTGVALCTSVGAARALDWSETLSAALAECFSARAEAWSTTFGTLRPHPGQIRAISGLNAALAGSGRVIRSPLAQRRLAPGTQVTEADAGQDAYTLRCAPQVIGAVRDTLDWHDRILLTELNAATDNPLFPDLEEETPVLHGGNFMGQHVGLASDALSNGLCVLAGLAERQLARLTDERLNRGLPAFLHEGAPGLNSGFMGAQVTATALLAEMRTSGAASVQSISTNGANQDVVSMGTIAARLAADKLATLWQIQAILALAVAQAIDLLQDRGDAAFSPSARALHGFVRQRSARLTGDRPLSPDITTLADCLSRYDPAAH